jgi:hypothetical protein
MGFDRLMPFISPFFHVSCYCIVIAVAIRPVSLLYRIMYMREMKSVCGPRLRVVLNSCQMRVDQNGTKDRVLLSRNCHRVVCGPGSGSGDRVPQDLLAVPERASSRCYQARGYPRPP